MNQNKRSPELGSDRARLECWGGSHGSGKACIESQGRSGNICSGVILQAVGIKLEEEKRERGKDTDLGFRERTTKDNRLPSDTGGSLRGSSSGCPLSVHISGHMGDDAHPFLQMQLWGTCLRSYIKGKGLTLYRVNKDYWGHTLYLTVPTDIHSSHGLAWENFYFLISGCMHFCILQKPILGKET